MTTVYHQVDSIIGSVITLRAEGVAYREFQPQRGCISKPRVARIRATLGNRMIKNINPNGVAHYFSINTTSACCSYHYSKFIICNPVGVDKPYASPPRVARIRATLGFGVQPPWGCGSRGRSLYSWNVQPPWGCGSQGRSPYPWNVQPPWDCGSRGAKAHCRRSPSIWDCSHPSSFILHHYDQSLPSS